MQLRIVCMYVCICLQSIYKVKNTYVYINNDIFAYIHFEN